MKHKSKWVGMAISLSLAMGIMAGCSSQEPKAQKTTEPPLPKMVQETSIKIDHSEKVVTEVGYLNRFTENNLVEFKVKKGNKETLQVVEMEQDIYSYLSKQKPDGKTLFTITYEKATNGIANPILIKIERK